MANESVPGTSKPITLLAFHGRLNVWLRPGGFHPGQSTCCSPKGRIHDCNRTACQKAIYSVTCRRDPYTTCQASLPRCLALAPREAEWPCQRTAKYRTAAVEGTRDTGTVLGRRRTRESPEQMTESDCRKLPIKRVEAMMCILADLWRDESVRKLRSAITGLTPRFSRGFAIAQRRQIRRLEALVIPISSRAQAVSAASMQGSNDLGSRSVSPGRRTHVLGDFEWP